MGIEAAIVLIAFVLVASALAFVVLNMGMFTTQKTKEVIARAYEESTRAIDIAGNVKATVKDGKLQLVAIPIKLTSGARPIDLSKTAVAITVIKPDGSATHTDNAYDSSDANAFSVITDFGNNVALNSDLKATWVYVRSEDKGAGTCAQGTPKNGDATPENGDATPENGDATPENGDATPENGDATPENGDATPENGGAPVCTPGDKLLEPGEIVLLVFKVPEGTGAYSRIIVEIKPPQGATVTVERIVPPKLDSTYVDLDIG